MKKYFAVSFILFILFIFFPFLGLAAVLQPDWGKTPGALCKTSDSDFSSIDYPERIPRCFRHISANEKSQIAKDYGGIPSSQWSRYEFDHLIPLCAGGSNNLRNIWPQPLSQAHQKDLLEDKICRAMKNGTLTQKQAIQEVYDWFKFNVNTLGLTFP